MFMFVHFTFTILFLSNSAAISVYYLKQKVIRNINFQPLCV